MGFFELGHSENQYRCADRAEESEIGAPPNPFGEIGTDRGRYRRRQAHRHRDRRDGARRALAVEKVAHDRSTQHHPGAPTASLDHAADDQHRQRPSEPAQRRADEEQDKSGDQHRPAPETVGNWPVDELSHREAGEKQRQHQLDIGCGCIEHRGKERQRRHQHVQRRRCDRGYQDQQRQRRPTTAHLRAGEQWRQGGPLIQSRTGFKSEGRCGLRGCMLGEKREPGSGIRTAL